MTDFEDRIAAALPAVDVAGDQAEPNPDRYITARADVIAEAAARVVRESPEWKANEEAARILRQLAVVTIYPGGPALNWWEHGHVAKRMADEWLAEIESVP